MWQQRNSSNIWFAWERIKHLTSKEKHILTAVWESGVHQRPFWGYNAESCSSGSCDVKIFMCTKFGCFHLGVRTRIIKQRWAGAGQDLQSGELAHVGEGWVGQRVDLIVAQVSEREMKRHYSSHCLVVCGLSEEAGTYTSCRYLKLDSSFGTTLNWFPSK